MGKLFKLKCIAVGVMVGLTYISAYGQDFSAFDKEVFQKEGKELPYRILSPQKMEPGAKYPLLVFLHGSGERGTDNELQLKHGGELFLRDSIRSKFPAYVVFPKCRENFSWNNTQYAQIAGTTICQFPKEQKPNLHLELLEGLIEKLRNEFAIDKHRLYIGGLSNGGMGTFEMVRRNPNMFAAAFPICGGANPQIAEQISSPAWWIFHGLEDDVILARYSEKIGKALKETGADTNLSLYEGVKHDSWTNAFAEPNLLPWLFSHKKE